MKLFFKKYWKIILWASILCLLSLGNTNKIPKIHRINIPHLDKIAHLGMYFIFSFLLYTSFSRGSAGKNFWKMTICLAITLFYGALMEILQYLLTNYRTADKYDMLFNSIGAVLGIIGYNIFYRIKLKKIMLLKLIISRHN